MRGRGDREGLRGFADLQELLADRVRQALEAGRLRRPLRRRGGGCAGRSAGAGAGAFAGALAGAGFAGAGLPAGGCPAGALGLRRRLVVLLGDGQPLAARESRRVDELGAGRVGDLPLERVAVLRLGGFLPPRDVRTDIKGVGGAGQAGPDFRELGKT